MIVAPGITALESVPRTTIVTTRPGATSIGVELLSVQDVALLPVSVKSAVVSAPALSVTLRIVGVRVTTYPASKETG